MSHEVITVRLPYELHERLKERARRLGKSLNVTCRDVLEFLVDGRLFMYNARNERVHLQGVDRDKKQWSREAFIYTKRFQRQRTIFSENHPSGVNSDCNLPEGLLSSAGQ